MNEEIRQMAARIRELREICGLSAPALAAELHVPESVYQSWETSGEDVPISALYHLAHRFGVDLSELLIGAAPHLATYSVVRRGEGMSVDRYPGYRFHSLAHTFKHKMMEPLLVTVDAEDKDPALVTHAGQEFNFILEGVIELLFADKRVRLEPGDSVYFDPSHPHGQRAVGGRARFLTVISE
ncbi:MAG: XRE family transcriptional regulator [Oscillospiraceae bacterium]|jgi:transcriptional regulator with XRE-family HTH domain|nr:XRE family transcriptional regulator [Oscillospiraceae bacterium]